MKRTFKMKKYEVGWSWRCLTCLSGLSTAEHYLQVKAKRNRFDARGWIVTWFTSHITYQRISEWLSKFITRITHRFSGRNVVNALQRSTPQVSRASLQAPTSLRTSATDLMLIQWLFMPAMPYFCWWSMCNHFFAVMQNTELWICFSF